MLSTIRLFEWRRKSSVVAAGCSNVQTSSFFVSTLSENFSNNFTKTLASCQTVIDTGFRLVSYEKTGLVPSPREDEKIAKSSIQPQS